MPAAVTIGIYIIDNKSGSMGLERLSSHCTQFKITEFKNKYNHVVKNYLKTKKITSYIKLKKRSKRVLLRDSDLNLNPLMKYYCKYMEYIYIHWIHHT